MVPRCVVCRTELPADPVHCPRCETPHHADCWEYTGGCAIYGCAANRAAPPLRSPPVAWAPGERWRGALFGALVAFSTVACLFAALLRDGSSGLVAGVCGLAAGVAGACTGACVRGVEDTGNLFFWGAAGPGFGAWVLTLTLSLFSSHSNLAAAPVMLVAFLIAGLLMCPISLPLAYLIARFNDPRFKSPARQIRWAATALLAMLCVLYAVTTGLFFLPVIY